MRFVIVLASVVVLACRAPDRDAPIADDGATSATSVASPSASNASLASPPLAPLAPLAPLSSPSDFASDAGIVARDASTFTGMTAQQREHVLRDLESPNLGILAVLNGPYDAGSLHGALDRADVNESERDRVGTVRSFDGGLRVGAGGRGGLAELRTDGRDH